MALKVIDSHNTMIKNKELTEQAFALFCLMRELKSRSGLSTYRVKRLQVLVDKAQARYKRRLYTWWANKQQGDHPVDTQKKAI